jgi:hypothetical protein
VEADHHAWPVRDQIAPVLALRPRDRRRHDLEVLGAARIGQDDQVFAVVLDLVEHQRLAPGNEERRGLRIVPVEEPHLGGFVIVDRHRDEAV